MAAARRWITVTTASALGIGVIASSALGVANAMPLVDTSTVSAVPPISTVPDESKGTSPLAPGAPVVGPTGVPTPAPSSTTPSSTAVPAPAPAPQPVAPQPSATPSIASPASPVSPASIDD